MESVREHMRECPSESEIAQVVLQELEQRGNCTMEELIEPVAAAAPARKAKAAGGEGGIGALRPKRARITRVDR